MTVRTRIALTVGLLIPIVGAFVSVPAAGAAGPTVISFTFDDGRASAMNGQQLLHEHGMAGTFYINSGLIGRTGYMTRADLETLKDTGQEIAGHTVTHQSLLTLTPTEADRQVCQDRNTLLSWGYDVTTFAYPYADWDAAAEAVVQHCGYNTARAVGDIWSPGTCVDDCPATESFTPPDLFATRTPDQIDTGWTLEELQESVTRAEADGGWLAYNLHDVCDDCGVESISPALFDEFLDWLALRAPLGTVVKPVNQVVTGPTAPPVSPTPPAPAGQLGENVVQNPSLETPGDGSGNPECWTPTGYGTNTGTFERVTDSHSGTYAERLTVTGHTDGDRKLVPTFDLGDCSLTVVTGNYYSVSAWYKSTASVYITLYQRDATGQWSYWTQSPRFAASTDWAQATWKTPPVPTGMVAASFGVTLDSDGTLTTDDYSFANSPGLDPPAPPGVNALKNASLETLGGDGFPQCWAGAGYGTNTPAWTRVTDASDGTYAQQLEITGLTDGDAKLIPTFDSANCAPTVNVGAPYALAADYKATAPVFYTLYRQDNTGSWSYWTQSPTFPATATYTRAEWTSPPVPADTQAVSIGLTLNADGTLTTDNYSMVDASSP